MVRTMSVLIKDMALPKDCPYCKMAYYNASDEFTGCAVVPDKRYAMHNDPVYAKSTQRPDWCPLVEIPVHGRLIDGDALDTRVRQAGGMGNVEEECTEDFNDGVLFVLDYFVKNAPTVIEGSEHNA